MSGGGAMRDQEFYQSVDGLKSLGGTGLVVRKNLL